VWLAYPGETPEINFNSGGRDARIFFYDKTTNLYLDGFDFNVNSNSRGIGVAISNGGNTTVRKSTFRGLTNCCEAGEILPNCFSAEDPAGILPSRTTYRMAPADTGSLAILRLKLLLRTITFLPIYRFRSARKHGNQHWTIRGNHIEGQTTRGAIYAQEYDYSGDIEICFNLIQMSASDGVALTLVPSDPGGPINIYRNTFVGHINVNRVRSTNGPFTINNNVIINNSASPDKITRSSSVSDESRLIVVDNLTGTLSDNIVDSNGNLTSAYKSYLGSRGHQIGDQLAPPQQVRLVVR
jgi:hypothetical protein